MAHDEEEKEGGEAEGLLTGQPRTVRAKRKDRGDTIYDTEEGESRSSIEDSHDGSDAAEIPILAGTHVKKTSGTSCRYCGFAAIYIAIILAFFAFLYGAHQASHTTTEDKTSTKPAVAKSLSNGTHVFAPTTLLISLDGFRADFLRRNLTPTMDAFVRSGVSPRYMNPSFPSLTFPNHYTLATGHYPESHGIVGNSFWDPTSQKEFYYTDPSKSMIPEWWNAEPLWETAELAGVRTAIHMWPGSEAHIGTKEPAYVDKFNAKEPLDSKVRRILGWLDLPGPDDAGADPKSPRPQLIAAYVPDVDADGHLYGPNSTYIRSTIRLVDGMLGTIFQGIEDRNLTDVVNVVVVSDHGMATTSTRRLIQLEDLIDTSLIEHTDGWPLYGLRPYDTSEQKLREIYDGLVTKSQLPEYKGHFDVYLRDENMPARYHFSQNLRIAPLWIVPQAGWAIVTRDEFNVAEGVAQDLAYHPRGLHGYDHDHPLMRAIFLARGPAFPHPRGSLVDPFQNIEVYNIICDSLGIEPRPNNGTLRLPLTTSGLHPVDHSGEDAIDDFTDDDEVSPEAATRPDVIFPLTPVPPPAESDSSSVEEQDKDENLNNWLGWIGSEFDSFKNWASGLFGGTGDKTDADTNNDR